MSPCKIKVNWGIFDKVYLPFFNKKQRRQIYFGGGSSGKSFTFMNFAVLWALEGRTILVIRKVGATIRQSVWSECTVAIERLGLQKYFDIHKTERTIYSLVSGGVIMFKGIDDEEKIKSIRSPRNGAIDTVLCDEATELFANDISQLMIRQRGKSKFPKRIILIFNPIHTQHHIYKNYFANLKEFDGYYEDDKIVIKRTTYKDNSHLSPEDIETLEGLKFTSPLHYSVYCLGLWGTLGDIIFANNVKVIKAEEVPSGLSWLAGIDFGYMDETAYVKCGHDRGVNNIYITQEVFAKKLSYDVLAESIDKSIETTADNEDPRSISILAERRVNIRAAKKGPGSVFGGIMWLLTKNIHIVETCTNTVHAYNNYAWKKDKRTGEAIDEPGHEFSHLCDATRYCFERYSRGFSKVRATSYKI
jgi:phage terminase large subunit